MRVLTGSLVLVVGLAFVPTIQAEEVKSGPDKRIGGAFQVKAFTGDQKGKQLCYV